MSYEKSTIFQGGKTQVPVKVRSGLGVRDGDILLWIKRAEGYLVTTGKIAKLFSSTLSYGGVTCPKCGNRYDAGLDMCPKCGARALKMMK